MVSINFKQNIVWIKCRRLSKLTDTSFTFTVYTHTLDKNSSSFFIQNTGWVGMVWPIQEFEYSTKMYNIQCPCIQIEAQKKNENWTEKWKFMWRKPMQWKWNTINFFNTDQKWTCMALKEIYSLELTFVRNLQIWYFFYNEFNRTIISSFFYYSGDGW